MTGGGGDLHETTQTVPQLAQILNLIHPAVQKIKIISKHNIDPQSVTHL